MGGVSAGRVERVAELVGDLTGAAVSTGWVHGRLAEADGAVAPAVDAMAERIVAAEVVEFDETTLRVGPEGPEPVCAVGVDEGSFADANATVLAMILDRAARLDALKHDIIETSSNDPRKYREDDQEKRVGASRL